MINSILAQAEPVVRIEREIEFTRWTVGTGLVIGVGLAFVLAYAVWWFYRHEGRGQVTTFGRRAMQALRLCVLMLLGLIGLEPVLAKYLHRRIDATTVLLVDDSASMSVRDHYRDAADEARAKRLVGRVPPEGVARFELAKKLLGADGANLIDKLAKNNRVKTFLFSDIAKAIQLSGATSQPALPNLADGIRLAATGPATDIGRAVRQAMESLAGSPVAGVVLLSDGGFNSGESPDVVARFLQSRSTPLYAVGIGDPADVVNVRVTEVSGPRSAFAKDPFTITVQVAAEGIGDESLTVELLRRISGTDPDTAAAVERRTIRAKSDGTFDPIQFSSRVDTPGRMVYTARISPLPFEAIETDNARDTTPPIQVLDSKMRVLIVAGAPTYEYRFLSHLLERDETVDVSCWLQSADNRAVRDGDLPIDHLPTTTQELFVYDVVILLDPNPAALDPEWSTRVASLVDDYGGGLLYAADVKWTTAFLRDPKNKPIVESLPIVVEPEAELILNQLGQFQRTIWPIVIPPDMFGSPLLRQAETPAENAQVWSVLDGVYWHYPVRREKPAATVLMRHGNPRMIGQTGPQVLYATQYVGAGRTAFLAFNSTWRWQRYGEQYFERFWIQAIRFLMEGKLLGGKKRGTIITDRDDYSVGETIVLTLRALDEKFEPLIADTLELEAAYPSEAPRKIALAPIPGRDGFFTGRFVADRAGTLRLSVTMPVRSGTPEPVTRDLVINQADLELRRPVMRRDLLGRLAELSGGKYYEMDDTDALAARIKDAGVSYVTKERPIPLWDNGWVFGAIIVLLSAEWIWRKRAKLL